jgi:hypothetical protein
MYDQNIIEPKNIPMWMVAIFIVSALALILALTSLSRIHATAVITGAELVVLNQRIESLTQQVNKSVSTAQVGTVKP